MHAHSLDRVKLFNAAIYLELFCHETRYLDGEPLDWNVPHIQYIHYVDKISKVPDVLDHRWMTV